MINTTLWMIMPMGGAGMVMKPEPVFEAVETIKASVQSAEDRAEREPAVILLTPQGRLFSQSAANELAKHDWMMLICGHYEGVDERIREHLVTDEISIGDYVLTEENWPPWLWLMRLSDYCREF